LGWPREIDRNIAVVQRIVKKLDVLSLVEIPVRLPDILKVPIVLVTEEDACVSDDFGISQGRLQSLNLMANLADFGVGPVLAGAIVRQNATIKFFRANSRLPPEKVEHATRAP